MTTRGDGARNNLARRLDVPERERERETTGKSAFFLPEFSRLTLSHRTLTECISNEYREKFLTSALSLSAAVSLQRPTASSENDDDAAEIREGVNDAIARRKIFQRDC